MNTILVATDGSPPARAAVELGAALAAEHGAELILAHVVPALDVTPAGRLPLSGVVPHEPSEQERAVLDEAADAVAALGGVATTCCSRATRSRSWCAAPTPTTPI